MADQKYPIEYPGHPTAEMTCSMPIKGQNVGCPAWMGCTEHTKGKYPVIVWTEDYVKRQISRMPCMVYQKYIKGEHKHIRVARPETVRRVVYEWEYPDRPVGQMGRRIEKFIDEPQPPEAMRGRKGFSNYASGSTTGRRVDLLGKTHPSEVGEPEPSMLGAHLPGGASAFEEGQEAKPPVAVDTEALQSARPDLAALSAHRSK